MPAKTPPPLKEADVEQRVLTPLFADLGYGLEDITPKHPVTFREGRRGRKAEADFVLFAGPDRSAGTALAVVEAKRPGEDLEAARRQAESYAAALHAPFVLLTDGEALEVWQRSAARPSERVFHCRVDGLAAARGELRLLMQKDAAIAHREALGGPRIAAVIGDFSDYLRAETERTQAYAQVIARRLQPALGHEIVSTRDLLAQAPRGAVVTATSGLGKTQLSYALHRQALAARLDGTPSPVPVHIVLPELAAAESLFAYAAARLEARRPGFSVERLRDLIAGDGLLLVLDGFDRLSHPDQDLRQAELRRMLRDASPGLQIIVLSRASAAPVVELPVLALQPLDQEERWRAVEAQGVPDPLLVVGRMPGVLSELCGNPLILARTVEHRLATGRLPSRLNELFRYWLDAAIQADPRDPAEAARREAALTLLARRSRGGRLPAPEALKVLAAEGFAPEIFNRLVACDALSVVAGATEFVHEALSDYLLALAIAQAPLEAALREIGDLVIDADSLLPVLLMGMLTSPEACGALWRRLSGLGLRRFIEVLRYRNDLSRHFAGRDEDETGLAFLAQVHEGMEIPLWRYFPALRLPLLRWFGVQEPDFKVAGRVAAGVATWSIQPCVPSAARIALEEPGLWDHPYWVGSTHLVRAGLRLDSGRLIALQQLYRALVDVVDRRDLAGGDLWRRERLLSRLAWIGLTLRLPLPPSAPLSEWRSLLSGLSRETQLPMIRGVLSLPEVLTDLDAISASVVALDDWAPDLRDGRRFNLPDARVAELVQEKYRRGQLIYRELVEHSVPALAADLGFPMVLPVRYAVTILPDKPNSTSRWAHRIWRPVETWDQAGADVVFSDVRPAFDRAHFDDSERALTRLNRSTRNVVVEWGSGQIFSTEGLTARSVRVETPAMQTACRWLRDGLGRLFAGLPSDDAPERDSI